MNRAAVPAQRGPYWPGRSARSQVARRRPAAEFPRRDALKANHTTRRGARAGRSLTRTARASSASARRGAPAGRQREPAELWAFS
jgi:hypothetical protein